MDVEAWYFFAIRAHAAFHLCQISELGMTSQPRSKLSSYEAGKQDGDDLEIIRVLYKRSLWFCVEIFISLRSDAEH